MFTVFLGVGVLAVNFVTVCPAEAAGCGGGVPGGGAQGCRDDSCTAGPSATDASATFTIIGNTIILPSLVQAQAILTAYMIAQVALFTATVTAALAPSIQNMGGWWGTFWYYNLQPTMQMMTDQLSVPPAAQSLSIGYFMDAANVSRVRREIKGRELETHRELRPGDNTCVAGTVVGGMTRVAGFRRAYNASAPAEKLPRSGNTVGLPSAKGFVPDVRDRWQEYVTRYCRKDYNNGTPAGPTECLVDAPFADQNVDVTGTIFLADTIDLTNLVTGPDLKRSIDDLITNIAEPFVKEPVPPTTVPSVEGQIAILEGESYKAKRQVIYDSLYHIVARRVPGSVDRTLPVDPFAPNGYLSLVREAAGVTPPPATVISPNPSHNEILQALMVERFRSGKYALGQIDEPENNRREMVIQQALQVMQMNDQLDLMDRYSLLLAAQAGAEIREAKSLGIASTGARLQ
ncbi:MAG: hypothetical protein V1721_05905 [Pseudomonadota bacterium]